MDFDSILAVVTGAFPTVAAILSTVLVVLGSLTVLGTVVDSLIPDEKDGGFMTKILAIAVLGPFLTWTTKFSPFNIKPKV